MKLYDYYRSSACYRVRIALHYKHIPFEVHTIHLVNDGGEQHKAEYKALNPQGLVPTLEIDGTLLTQSLAIIGYLEERFPHPSLLPIDAMARAEVNSLALSIACDLHPLNNARVLSYLKQTFDANETRIQEWYHHWLKEAFDALETRLQQLPRTQDVCYGNRVTLADVCLIPQVYNAKRFHFPLDKYPLIQRVNDYCTTLDGFIAAFPIEPR